MKVARYLFSLVCLAVLALAWFVDVLFGVLALPLKLLRGVKNRNLLKQDAFEIEKMMARLKLQYLKWSLKNKDKS